MGNYGVAVLRTLWCCLVQVTDSLKIEMKLYMKLHVLFREHSVRPFDSAIVLCCFLCSSRLELSVRPIQTS